MARRQVETVVYNGRDNRRSLLFWIRARGSVVETPVPFLTRGVTRVVVGLEGYAVLLDEIIDPVTGMSTSGKVQVSDDGMLSLLLGKEGVPPGDYSLYVWVYQGVTDTVPTQLLHESDLAQNVKVTFVNSGVTPGSGTQQLTATVYNGADNRSQFWFYNRGPESVETPVQFVTVGTTRIVVALVDYGVILDETLNVLGVSASGKTIVTDEGLVSLELGGEGVPVGLYTMTIQAYQGVTDTVPTQLVHSSDNLEATFRALD